MTEKSPNSPKQVPVQIPLDLLSEVDLLLWDPAYNQIEYGARSKLIVRLLREWVSKRKKTVVGVYLQELGVEEIGGETVIVEPQPEQ